MKKPLFLFGFALFMTISASAQSDSYQTLKDTFKGGDDVFSISVNGMLCRTALRLADEHEFCNAITDIQNIRVIVIPAKEFRRKDLSVGGFKKILKDDSFKELATVRDSGDDVSIFLQENSKNRDRYFFLIDEGDEVIIPSPFWVTYSEIVKMAGGKVKIVNTSISNGYKITAAELEQAMTEKTKLFMFSSPCNPSGAVYSKAELTALAEVFKKHPAVFIMSDEIYEYINYEGRHESIAQFGFLKDRVIIINGLSKGYAMTGWRLGYIAAHATIAKACEKIQGQVTSGPNAVTQRAGITALTTDMKPTAMMVAEFTKRRTRVMELLKEMPGIVCSEPQGAFYVFPQVNSFFGKADGEHEIKNADDLCMYLLNNAHVSTVTGSAFGEPNCIRISFASCKNCDAKMKSFKRSFLTLFGFDFLSFAFLAQGPALQARAADLLGGF